MPSIYDFATWEPALTLLRAANAETLAAPGGHVAGRIGHDSWGVPFRARFPPGRAAQVSDMQEELDAVRKVQAALTEAGLDGISFKAEISPGGHATLRLFTRGPTVETYLGAGAYPGTILRSEDAVPGPWRRLPDPNPTARPHQSADPAFLERVLRERFPNATGATEEELAAAEARLGIPLPDELKALYRVVRGRPGDSGDGEETWSEVSYAIIHGVLLPLDQVRIEDTASRPCPWQFAALEAVITPPGAAVQQLVGSPGWIVFGDDHGNSRYAIDLTPGPRGHAGQVIGIPIDENIGACLKAASLTDFMRGKPAEDTSRRSELPAIARVNKGALQSIEAAVHPDLEVLSIGVRDGEPLSLAPVIGLPKLRTLSAHPGTLASPLEITELTNLEFLELGPEEWRLLLGAKAVPRSLLAAKITVRGNPIPLPQPGPLPFAALANEILALWDHPPITGTVLDGQLPAVTSS